MYMLLVNELLSGTLGFLSCTILGSPVVSNHLVYSSSCLVYCGFIIIYSQTLTSYINALKDINTFMFLNKSPPKVD